MPGLDLDHLRSKKARRMTSGWSPKEGANRIRVLPPNALYFTEGLKDFALEFRSHFVKAEGADTQVFRCLRDKKEVCPFCAAVQKYRTSENPVLKKAAEDLRASERHLMNIINLNDLPAGIQSYECGPKVYDFILDYMANPAWGDLVSPTEGRNITLNQTPQGKSRSGFVEYSVQPDPDKTSVAPHLAPDFHEKLDALELAVSKYPESADIMRWLTLLGMADVVGPTLTPAAVVTTPATGTGVGTAAPPPPIAQTPVVAQVTTPTPVAPATATAPTGTDPISVFAATKNLGVKADNGKVVPGCYSEGPANKAVGFNPAKWPCEQGCPVRADCTLKSLGLA